MKITNLIILIIIIFSFSNCSKDQLNPTNQEITLVSPLDNIEEYRDIDFTWETNINERLRFEIAETEDFESVIIDSLIDSLSANFFLNKALKPKANYFWRVSLNESINATGSFNTIDIISQYEGEYKMKVRRVYWVDGNGPFGYDTTYIDNLDLEVVGDKIKLTGASFQDDFTEFDQSNNNDIDILKYSEFKIYLRIYLNSDSIFAYHEGWGGQGSGIYWEMSGVKIE